MNRTDPPVPGLLYHLEGVRRSFSRGDTQVKALDGVDLMIRQGEFVAIVGPSGSGKTTLLQLLGALDRPSGGRISLEERDLASLSDSDLTDLRLRTLGFVFQQFNLIPTLTARQNVEAAMAPAGLPTRERRQRADAVLERLGLGPRRRHLPSAMSGGEQQRVAIARALVNRPRVLLADEPTGNLDTDTGTEIVSVLRSLWEEQGQTIVIVTHDAAIADAAHRVLQMRDGVLLSESATEPDAGTAIGDARTSDPPSHDGRAVPVPQEGAR